MDEGKLSRHYCGSKGPRDIRPLHLISHSFSLPQLRLLFSDSALGNLSGKTLVDVGSRLGAVLWAGAAYSKAKRLVGVELSAHFASTQQQIIDGFRLGERVQVRASPPPSRAPSSQSCNRDPSERAQVRATCALSPLPLPSSDHPHLRTCNDQAQSTHQRLLL